MNIMTAGGKVGEGRKWKTEKLTLAFSVVVNTPVDSTMYSAPADPHWMAEGSFLQ